MNFGKVNNIAGWIVCAIASLVYIMTSEMRGSFWDCGEFVSACFKVQLPHPPGAPLFVLMGRFFIILFGDDPMTAAKAVNIMNSLASGFTILFLFWSITHFARKMMTGFREVPNGSQTAVIIGAGLVGALAYTFSDSFWYSAVEGEVYALSSLFTALAFWTMLKWERADDAAGNDRELRNRADRWIVFLFFSLGLSIGIHLLGLLVIPAAVMIYYYKRYNYTRKGAIWAFIVGCLITGIVQVVIIKWMMNIAGRFDIFFVNTFKLPFFSGFTFFFILLAGLVWWGLRVAQRNNWSYLRLGLWSFSFMVLGYSTYITTMERSTANPSMDMNNVDNPMSLVYYLGREQYGSQPILYGTHFLAQPTGLEDGKTRFVKGPDNYIRLAPDKEYTYDKKDYRLFPRVWDASNEQRHADTYIDWLSLERIPARTLCIVTGMDNSMGIIQVQDETGKTDNYQYDPDSYAPAPGVRTGTVIQKGMPVAVKIPTFGNNIEWFMTYQMGFMYWRYFMWNFAGKQNDIQGGGNVRDGNWISGISFIDNQRLGDQKMMPGSISDNKENNRLFLLPFILGIIGCVFQFFRNRRDWVVAFLLFFMTGIAVIIYLNQAGNQPRERDYAFASSFYAYAIWIGLAVVAIARMAWEKTDKLTLTNVIGYGSITTFIISLMSSAQGTFGGALVSSFMIAILYAAITGILTMASRGIGRTNLKTIGIAATAFCLITPIVMAIEEWDDHDRSNKVLAPDLAHNYLESCPKDAILFTFGDNDTYPLWYAQEVEGVRPDIRIVNTSLLGIDWYVNQLRYKVNESAPFDVIWTPEQIRGLGYLQNAGDRNNQTQPLYEFMKNTVGPTLFSENKMGLSVTFPSKLTVPVDVTAVKSQGILRPEDSVATQITLDIPPNKSFFSLDQLTMLNILATTNFRRPICFTSRYDDIGFGPYLRQEGLIYRVVPAQVTTRAQAMEVEKTKDLLINTFRSGNANVPGVYFDEENRRHLLTIRTTYAIAAINLAEQGRKDEAKAILDKSESLIDPVNMPYALVSRDNQHNRMSMIYLEAAYRAGHDTLINKLKTALTKDFNDQIKYYEYLRDNRPDFYSGDLMAEENFSRDMLQRLAEYEKTFNPGPLSVPELPGNHPDSQDTNRTP